MKPYMLNAKSTWLNFAWMAVNRWMVWSFRAMPFAALYGLAEWKSGGLTAGFKAAVLAPVTIVQQLVDVVAVAIEKGSIFRAISVKMAQGDELVGGMIDVFVDGNVRNTAILTFVLAVAMAIVLHCLYWWSEFLRQRSCYRRYFRLKGEMR